MRRGNNNFFTVSAVPKQRPVKLIDEMPQEEVLDMGIKLYVLMNLTWGYIGTILDLSAQMKIPETRELSRRIREIRREYDQFRAKSIDGGYERKELSFAEDFEEGCADDFSRLFNALDNEAGKLGLTRDHRMLVVAVYQALTLMDAVKRFARYCDGRIKARGIWVTDCVLLQKEFMNLYPLVPLYAGDCELRTTSRELTARILVNRMIEVETHA